MNELILYKLTSGEEVVAKQAAIKTDTVVIEDAVTLVYHQVGEGKMSVGFAPFMPYAEGTIELNKSSIAAFSPPKDQIAQEHMRVFSGIVLAPPGSKLA